MNLRNQILLPLTVLTASIPSECEIMPSGLRPKPGPPEPDLY